MTTDTELLDLIGMLADELETATDWNKGYARKDLVAFAVQVRGILHEERPRLLKHA